MQVCAAAKVSSPRAAELNASEAAKVFFPQDTMLQATKGRVNDSVECDEDSVRTKNTGSVEGTDKAKLSDSRYPTAQVPANGRESQPVPLQGIYRPVDTVHVGGAKAQKSAGSVEAHFVLLRGVVEAIGVRAHVLLEELREQGAALDEYGAEQRVQMQVADAVGHHQLRHRIGLGIASVGDGVLGQVIARGRHVLHANIRLVAP